MPNLQQPWECPYKEPCSLYDPKEIVEAIEDGESDGESVESMPEAFKQHLLGCSKCQ